MATVMSSAPRVDVPLDSYRVLEQHLKQVRMVLLKRAWHEAKQRLAPEKDATIEEVTRIDALTALKDVANRGIRGEEGASLSSELLANVPDEVYLEIDHRLDGLRPLVTQAAIGLATESGFSDKSLVRPSLNPNIMETAWNLVWNNPALRHAGLARSENLLPENENTVA